MGHIRIQDTFYSHPKFLDLSDGAIALWVKTLAWANANETDGGLRMVAVRHLGGRRAVKHARELVTAGLWLENQDGYEIHDFCEYQQSREYRRKRAKAEAERQRNRRLKEASDSDGVRSVHGADDARTTQHVGDAYGSTPRGKEKRREGKRTEAEEKGAAAAAPPRALTREYIQHLLDSDDVFRPLDRAAVAKRILGNAVPAGRSIDHIAAAIAECADKSDGLGLNAPTLQAKLIGFCKSVPRPPSAARSAPEEAAEAPRIVHAEPPPPVWSQKAAVGPVAAEQSASVRRPAAGGER